MTAKAEFKQNEIAIEHVVIDMDLRHDTEDNDDEWRVKKVTYSTRLIPSGLDPQAACAYKSTIHMDEKRNSLDETAADHEPHDIDVQTMCIPLKGWSWRYVIKIIIFCILLMMAMIASASVTVMQMNKNSFLPPTAWEVYTISIGLLGMALQCIFAW
eukprot:525921_1